MAILIFVVKSTQSQKEVPSTDGMQLSMKTSELLKLRLANDLPGKHISQLKTALEQCDFASFCEIAMREANQLHAVCLDTMPAIFYIDETSKLIVNAVRDLNANGTVAGYSIDAGNHVFVFCKQD